MQAEPLLSGVAVAGGRTAQQGGQLQQSRMGPLRPVAAPREGALSMSNGIVVSHSQGRAPSCVAGPGQSGTPSDVRPAGMLTLREEG